MNNNSDPMPAVFIFEAPPPQPAPVVRYQVAPSLERIERLEAEVHHLTATVEELKQQVAARSMYVRRSRQRWHRRVWNAVTGTEVETATETAVEEIFLDRDAHNPHA